MASTTATRLWRVSKAAGRPFPKLDDDDVIDFQIMEAVAVKIQREDEKAEKEYKKRQWRKDNEGIDRLKQIAGG